MYNIPVQVNTLFLIGTNSCVQENSCLVYTGWINKDSYVGTLFKVHIIQDSVLFRVQFRQVPLYKQTKHCSLILILGLIIYSKTCILKPLKRTWIGALNEQLSFIYRLKLYYMHYSLMRNLRLTFIDSDLLCGGALYWHRFVMWRCPLWQIWL